MMKYVAVSALLLGTLLMQACAISTANISDVRICESLEGDECAEDMQRISASTEVIYLSAQLHDAVEGTEITYTVRQVSSGEEASDSWTTDKGGSGPFSLSWNRPADGWVTGEYEMVLSLGTDNSDPIIKTFEIRQ